MEHFKSYSGKDVSRFLDESLQKSLSDVGERFKKGESSYREHLRAVKNIVDRERSK